MSKKKVYMAIDAHARNCVLGCMSARGEFQRTWTFKTCEKELIRHVDGVEAGTKLLAIEEGTLTYWIAQTIRPYVSDVLIADPKQNPSISRNAMKNDKVDVRQLCRLLRLDELKRVYHPENDDRAVFKAAVQQYIDFRNQEALEKLIEKRVKELAGPILRYGAQLVADQQEMCCPHCDSELLVEEHHRERMVNTVFGEIPIQRSYGFCKTCKERLYPADHALGLQVRSPASPRVQEISALAVLRNPAGRAPEDVRRMTGLEIGPSTLHREARRRESVRCVFAKPM